MAILIYFTGTAKTLAEIKREERAEGGQLVAECGREVKRNSR